MCIILIRFGKYSKNDQTKKGNKMRYIVDLSQNHVNEISYLINKGRYQNFAQFIMTAVENQIHIEKADIEEKDFPETPKKDFETKKHYQKKKPSFDLSVPTALPGIIPPPNFSELACSLDERDEEQCWLWGQINKIFPVKIGLRALLNFLDSEESMELEKFRDKAAEVAVSIGKEIQNYEIRENIKRDNRVSTGLPIGAEEYKSKMRYKGHFLALMRKDRKLDGALTFLRFVNLIRNDNGTVKIGLTEAGLQFACLENPIIDKNIFNVSLDKTEISFYLDHVSKNVKGEFTAIKWLLEKLQSGLRHNEEINQELKISLGNTWGASDAIINTQRAGLMARMIELGLIERYRKGVRVYYYISESGKEILLR